MTELKLMQRVQDKSLYWELRVRSEVKPNLSKVGILEFERKDQRQAIGVLGGAMAEELCEQYNDTIEPSAVARAAMEAYREHRTDNPHIFAGDELPRDADRNIAAGRVARR